MVHSLTHGCPKLPLFINKRSQERGFQHGAISFQLVLLDFTRPVTALADAQQIAREEVHLPTAPQLQANMRDTRNPGVLVKCESGMVSVHLRKREIAFRVNGVAMTLSRCSFLFHFLFSWKIS